MKYTQYGGNVDATIAGYLDKISKIIVREVPETISILLGGGFGRGEGSVVVNGKIVIPQNDFELFLITEKSVDEKKINRVANEAIKIVNVGQTGADFYHFKQNLFSNTFYLDVKAIPIKKLPHLIPMFRYYELKYGSHLLWGRDYRNLIPNYKVSDLPLTEGLRLLLNRMALLCLYFTHSMRKKMSYSQKHGLMYLGSKALIDLAGALTQLNGTYKPSYLHRVKILKKTYARDFPILKAKIPELPQIIDEATNFKMKPDFNIKIDPFLLWQKQKKYIEAVTNYFASSFFGHKFKNIFSVADDIYKSGYKYYYHPHLNYYLKSMTGISITTPLLAYLLIPVLNLLYFFRLLTLQNKFYPRVLFHLRAPDLTIFAAMIFLLYGASDKIDRGRLNKARHYLAKTYPLTPLNSGSLEEEWETTRIDFSNAFLLFSFLKIV